MKTKKAKPKLIKTHELKVLIEHPMFPNYHQWKEKDVVNLGSIVKPNEKIKGFKLRPLEPEEEMEEDV